MLLLSALALGLVDTGSSSSSSNLTDFILQESFIGSLDFDTDSVISAGSGIASDFNSDNPINSNNTVMPFTNLDDTMHLNSLTAASSVTSGVTSTNNLGSGGSGGVLGSSGESSIGSASSGGTIPWDNNGTFRAINPGDWCLMWQEPHHLYFQLGNAFFFLAFLAPHRPCGMLWLRAFLVIGSILMGMYGYLVECTPDVALWSGLFLGVNFIYLLVVLFRLRPVRFEKEIEAVYVALFKPLRVSRHQFRKVLNCMKVIRSLKYQEVYAQEKVTKVDSLSLVLSGKLVVSQNQRALHIVFAHQFLDSPEWFGVSTDDFFQVSIMAMEESRVLIWHRDKLKLSIMTEPFLQTVFDHILGRDVVKKLMQVTQVSESIASNGFIPSGIGNGYDDADDKQPMLIMKKSVDVGHGLTALINRQLQEEHVPLLGRCYTNDSLSVNSPMPVESQPATLLANNRMTNDEHLPDNKKNIHSSSNQDSYKEAYANSVPLKSLKEKKNKKNNYRKYENFTSPC